MVTRGQQDACSRDALLNQTLTGDYRSESAPANASDDAEPKSSGVTVRHGDEAMVPFVPSETEAHIHFWSKDLENRRTISAFTARS